MEYLDLLTDETAKIFLSRLKVPPSHKVEILGELTTTSKGKEIDYKVTDPKTKEESVIHGVFKNFQYDITDIEGNFYTYYVKWSRFMMILIEEQNDPNLTVEQYMKDYNNYHKNEMNEKAKIENKENVENYYNDYILY